MYIYVLGTGLNTGTNWFDMSLFFKSYMPLVQIVFEGLVSQQILYH